MLGITKNKEASAAAREEQPVLPPIDVFENESEFLVIADMPGVTQGAADVTLEQDRLILQAAGASRRYRRELIVPPSVDAEKVSAAMKAGVLTVHLPKRAPYQPRRIQVRTV
jgi:HSP20 family protein